ncbi:hypothetical protein OVN20_10380 [Microcella daejeonensis]|uniref:hypothetical protein n=1 Tax=Microcella daejeonensis TaxID=2994971 RepID=UPI00226FA75C|nr:hypothetical protein [Microcella daejeonensis]WAB83460.1 hypothetical protein OVN20_10380 [Microcella daejeonensis]
MTGESAQSGHEAIIAPLGLLLDVDGPIASPESRTIAIPSIVDDLLTLAHAGVPVAFITGRSDEFMRSQVVSRLVAAGLRDSALVFGVFEKGGVWAPITPAGLGALEIDESVALPAPARAAVEELAREHYGHAMFVDDGKRVMVSLEQRVDAPAEVYRAAQTAFQAAAFALLGSLGVGIRYGTRVVADASGDTPFRIDPTIISTDIESVRLDKDRGADRALQWFAAHGVGARRWYSVGDSRSDYLMADHVHARGIPVAHVDVRPADGVLEREYEVIVEGELVHDHAGAAFLRRMVVEELGL